MRTAEALVAAFGALHAVDPVLGELPQTQQRLVFLYFKLTKPATTAGIVMSDLVAGLVLIQLS
jgi:hypothetical protein